jgi:transposase-like protein
MSINLIRFHELCKSESELIDKLKKWGLIPKKLKCKKCDNFMVLIHCGDFDWRWRCHSYIKRDKKKREKCSGSVRFRTGTFFEKSRLSLFKILGFAHLWAEGTPLRIIKRQLDIGSDNTLVDWSSFCREIMFNFFIDNSEPLGGDGEIVEIDESKFGKRKYHRGHPVEGQWVFGGYQRSNGRVFMVSVEDRKRATLLPIIRDWILPGTTIISDCWKAYDCLQDLEYEHLRVNHSLNFVDPESGAHTNGIESSWRAAKAITGPSGRRKSHIPGNLARYMFNKSCYTKKIDRTVELFRIAGVVYDPNKENEIVDEEEEGDLSFEMLD